MRTFAELFCERHHVAPENFVRAMFWRCLHRRALPFALFIFPLSKQYFAADFDLILGVGQLRSANHLADELDDFRSHPWNHGFVRNRLMIRVSFARLCHEVRQVLPYSKAPLPTAAASGMFDRKEVA